MRLDPKALERMRLGLRTGRPTWTTFWRCLIVVGIVLASTIVAETLHRLFNTASLATVFLAGVVVAAVTLGARWAYLTGGLAFAIYVYFMAAPPLGFQVSDPQDIIDLTVFLVVAVLTGALASRARDEGLKAGARAASTQALYETSRELSSAWDEMTIRDHLADRIARATGTSACILDAAGRVVASAGDPPSEAIARGFAARSSAPEPAVATDAGWRFRSLREEAAELGAAAWKVPTHVVGGAAGDEVDRIVNILVDLGAAAILRARLGAKQSELEASARTEQLRNALLSSISHDFRTPLAAILASATSLRELFDELDQPSRDDFLATIEEEAERLNRFVANLLHMSKLESGVVEPRRSIVDVVEVLNRIARRHDRGRDQGRVEVRTGQDELLVTGDAVLLEYALENIVENALRFSPPHSHVTLACARCDATVSLDVVDEGSGVDIKDLERIFDKFYQAEPLRPEAAGTGLGLSISKGLIEAMEGSVRAQNRRGRSGLRVTAVLPAAS